TKIMEIRVTLPDPKTAQALALYLGEETVKLNRTIDLESEQELSQAVEKQEAEARERLEHSEAAWTRTVAQQPVEGLQQDIQNGADRKGSLRRQLLEAEVDASETSGRDAGPARVRVETLRKQLAQVERDVAAEEDLLARRLAERDRLDAERIAGQTIYAN